MRAAQPAAAQTQGFAARALLCLELLTLAIGALQFAFVPNSVERPMLAAAALGLLTVSILFSRTVPAFQRPIARQHCIDIAALIVCITLFAVATGSAHSVIVPLYLIPLVGASLAFGRWWVVLLLTCGDRGRWFLAGRVDAADGYRAAPSSACNY